MFAAIGWELLKTHYRIKGVQYRIDMVETIRPCNKKLALEGTEVALGTLAIVSGIFGILLSTGVLPIGISNPYLLMGSGLLAGTGGLIIADGAGAFLLETLVKKKIFPSIKKGEYTYRKDEEGTVFYSRKDGIFMRIRRVHNNLEEIRTAEKWITDRGIKLKVTPQASEPAYNEYTTEEEREAEQMEQEKHVESSDS